MIDEASRRGKATVFLSEMGTPLLWSANIGNFLDPERLIALSSSGGSLLQDGHLPDSDIADKAFEGPGDARETLKLNATSGDAPVPARLAYASNGFLAVELGDVAKEDVGDACAPVNITLSRNILMECSVSADVAPWIILPETRDAWWSRHFFKMLGYEPGGFENTSKAFRELIHPDELPAAVLSMDSLIAGETDRYHAIFRLLHKDGTWRWHEATARMARQADGSEVVCGGLKDVHLWRISELERDRLFEENKRARAEAEAAQKAARENEELLRASVASGEQTAWSACSETGEAWMMEEGYRMMGYTPHDFRPDSEGWRSILHPDDFTAGVEKMGALYSGATEVYENDSRIRHKTGDYHWYRVIARLIDRTEHGLPPLLAGTTTRIDTLKENEKRLSDALVNAERLRYEAEETEELLRTAATCGELGLWSVNIDTAECWMMDETFRLLGYEPGAFVPDSEGWRALIHPEDLDKSRDAMTALITGESENYDVEERLRHADGCYRWYRTVARLITRPGVSCRIIAGTFSDISELKKKQADLEDAVSKMTAARAEWQEIAEIFRVSSESSNVIPWVRTPETGKSWFADNLAEMLGLEPGTQITSEIFRDYVHPDDQAKVYEQFDKIQRREMDILDVEHRVRGADGRWFWVQSRGRWIDRAKDGQASLICGSFVNVDKIKEQQEDLANAVVEAEQARAEAQQTAEILRVSSENSGVVPWFRIPDTDDFWFSPNIAGFLGLDDGTEVALGDWIARIHPDDLPRVDTAIEAIENHETDTFDVEIRVRHWDDTYFWCRSVGRRICRSDQGLPDLICGAQFNIHELKRSELRQGEAAAELKKANARLNMIADNAPAGIFEYRRSPDGTFEFPYTSAKFSDLFDLTPLEISDNPDGPFEKIHPADFERLSASIDDSEANLTTWTCRFRALHPQRGVVWLSGSSTPKRLEDGSTSWIGVLYDVTVDTEREIALKQAHELAERMRIENERLALHDALTGLPNRRYFDQSFERRLAESETGDVNNLCLMRIDLDKFKYINDTFGHEVGDQALAHVAAALQNSVRDSGLVARIGGDEFSVMLQATSTEDTARLIAERFMSSLTEPLLHDGRRIYITASVGIAYTDDLSGNGHSLAMEADTALYASKNNGRNRVKFFTPELKTNLPSNRGLAADLQEAIVLGQFVPFFQPQVSAVDHSFVGLETLLRWDHPKEGLIPPDEFIPIAQQMQLLSEIDHIVYRKSLEVLSDLRMEGLSIPKISFNVSAERICDPRILTDAAKVRKFPGTKFTFELLESILIEEEGPEFSTHVQELRNLEVDLEIDDFGSGHSSILSILEIEPSALKIDRRLITPLGQDSKYLDIIEGIIRMSKSMGIMTIAEGVENDAQADLLAGIGCDVLQGYLFSEPLPADEMRDFILASGTLPLRRPTRSDAV